MGKNIKTFSKARRNPDDNKLIYRALTITVIGNLFLAAMKFGVAQLSASSALYSDALNSISDVIYTVALIVGMLLAIQPPDPDHPQGHQRFEPVLGMIIGFSMAWAGWTALTNAIDKIRFGVPPFELGLPVLTLVVSTVVKALMYYLIKRIADQVSSATLQASAADNLADTATSLTAIAGIFLAKFVHPLADPIAAILVSLWIFKAVISVLNENFGFLTGAGISEEERNQIFTITQSVEGVLAVHQIIGEHIGSLHLIDIHVNAAGDTPLTEVHRIETEIKKRLKDEMDDIDRVYVHVEPPGYQ